MSVSSRVPSASPSASLLTPEDLRRQLEGRLELIEEALERYGWLEDALKDRDWQRLLRSQLALVARAVEGEAACAEALERATRRAEVEGWPKDSPVLALVREARALRTRLEARVRERLASVASVSGAPALEADLRRLAALVKDPVSLELAPGEPFSQRMASTGTVVQYAVGFLYPLGMLALLYLVLAAVLLGHALLGIAAGVLVLLGLANMGTVSQWMRPGTVWFTPQRLVWVPSLGEPGAVRLDSIADGGIRLEKGTVTVEGDRRLRISGLPHLLAERLCLWLETYRHPELRTRTTLVAHATEAMCFPAMLRRDKQWEQGHAVLMRRMLFFLPGADAGPALLRAASGRVLATRVELAWVLEALRWQPESDLDAYLLRAAKATRGAAWPADLARHSRDVPLEHQVHITYQDQVVVGQVHGQERDDAARILASWG